MTPSTRATDAISGPSIVLAAPRASIGIYRYACQLSAALEQTGLSSEVVERPSREQGNKLIHFHVGNSSRAYLPTLAFSQQRHIVTLHDIVPRNPWLRRVLTPLQTQALKRHTIIVHSQHAAAMLQQVGLDSTIHVIRHGMSIRSPNPQRVAALRQRFDVKDGRMLISAGILKKAKNVDRIIDAAKAFPEWRFIFAGACADKDTERAFQGAPANCTLIPHPDDALFEDLISASDFLLNFRIESVGEVSGPVLLAMGFNIPVVGYEVGFMPEYRGDRDILFPPRTPILQALHAIEQNCLANNRPTTSTQRRISWLDAARETAAVYRHTATLI